jgi:membrane protein YdbS with pleckstrin-like domain
MTDTLPANVWLSPSPRLWKMRCLEAGVVGGLVAVGAGLIGAASGAVPAVIAAGCALVVTAVILRFLRRRFRSWSYQERQEDLVVRRGVAFRRLSVVPYGRMQFVDVTAGPVERLFKLSTIKLHTAAAASDARIPGLEADEAGRLRDQLAALGEAKAAGL